jgi:tetratricopeptide (TPR) repeat protein
LLVAVALLIIARMLSKRHMLRSVYRLAGSSEYMRWTILSISLLAPLSAQACPDLSAFYLYGEDVESQKALGADLAPLMNECLRSSEYFALYGAAQMETGDLAEALELLERALLLDANNGAALIDYAQALYLRGQLFSALDLNSQIRARADVPENIAQLLEQREQQWRSQTRQHGFQADVLAGYDNNLNGAPDPGQITLTLSGEPVILTLNPEYQPVSGPYLNLRVGGQFRQLAADHQHNASAEMRGRVSEDTSSDLVQIETRYNYTRPRRDHAWQFGAALSHLFFGGSALYSAAEGNISYQRTYSEACTQAFDFASQYQLYEGQSSLNSIESKLGSGLNCSLQVLGKPIAVGFELSLLNNTAVNSGRPGGDRNGWQFNAEWQIPAYRGLISSQINHTELRDTQGYSELLDNGAERWLKRTYLLVQYRQLLYPSMAFIVNAYHQHQSSNIELFDSLDSTLEVGISISF